MTEARVTIKRPVEEVFSFGQLVRVRLSLVAQDIVLGGDEKRRKQTASRDGSSPIDSPFSARYRVAAYASSIAVG